MGVRLAFYFILLQWLIQAAVSEPDKSGCKETCGNVTIPYPFGMEEGCYTNSWFRVSCNDTDYGKKPFISRLNLELLGNSVYISGTQVMVNNPVTYVNCGSKDDNNGPVNLTGSPFFFSSDFNMFGSFGCGNLATISRNQVDRLGGCIQPRCGDPGSDQAGCFGLIPENLTSYTVNMTEIINPGKQDSKRCTSGFVLDLGYLGSDLTLPNDFSIETRHVSATLEWKNPVDCDLEASLRQEKATAVSNKSCTRKCGNVDIPCPFGIEEGCYMNDWFKVICNETGPFISRINLQLLSISFSQGSVKVDHPVTSFSCDNKDNNGISVNLTGSPFFFSYFRSAFWSSGCGKLASVYRRQADIYPMAGCLQPDCGNIETSSNNAGCAAAIPPGLSSFYANMTEIGSSNGSNSSCGSAFVIDLDYIAANATIKIEHVNKKHVPTILDWGIPKLASCKLKERSNTSCSSDRKYCWSNISSTHLCVCSVDFSFDSYSVDVCQEAGKCGNSRYNYCHMLCLNTPGNYCSSPCPDKYMYISTLNRCEPRTFPAKQRDMANIIGWSTSIGTIFLIIGTWRLYKVLKRRKNIKLRQKYFKRNGGLLLQQQLSSVKGNVGKIKLFTSNELEKATDYFNKNRILGRGGQGIVYKGMLTDGSIVAIKKPKMVQEKVLDEKKLHQFINEVIILSQINHRNVVKLLGCCLETKVPLLVSEFIPNGTLSQLVSK